jgi:uncharacterized protein
MQTSSNRFYRHWVSSGLVGFEVTVQESDIFFLADRDLSGHARASIIKYRKDIRDFIKRRVDFLTSLTPIPVTDLEIDSAPAIVKKMIRASRTAGVGPMAGVAGAVAEFVGMELLNFSKNIIVENGGDIFIKSFEDRKFGIFAGDSPLSGKVGIVIKGGKTPLGVSTSSGTVGHSLSFGNADAVTVVSKDTTLSDATATAVCNMVKDEKDIEKALQFSKTIEGIMGSVIIYKNKMGSIGDIELF